MKDILDTVILIMFVIMVAMFIINFNRQQINKYTNKLEENGSAVKRIPVFYGKIVLSPKKKIVPLQPLKAIN